MKLAVLSDIHGNWPALEAVIADIDCWGPDVVLVNGDVVNSGPESARCWQTIHRRQTVDGWQVLAGNHERYVLEWATDEPPRHGPAYDLIRLSHWTYQRMVDDVAALGALPARWQMALPDGTGALALHASMVGDRAGIYPDAPEEKVREMIDPAASVFLTAHTHLPDLRPVAETLVVNSGAVGWPGDGDGRSSYARLSWDAQGRRRVTIQRVAYDRAATERVFETSGLLAEGGAEALLSFLEWRLSRDLRTAWARRYRAAILAGTITHEASVAQFVADFRAGSAGTAWKACPLSRRSFCVITERTGRQKGVKTGAFGPFGLRIALGRLRCVTVFTILFGGIWKRKTFE